MKTVWLVEMGESCEGGDVVGVFATEELALEFCIAEGLESRGVDYVEIKEVQVIEHLPAPVEDERWLTRGVIKREYL